MTEKGLRVTFVLLLTALILTTPLSAIAQAGGGSGAMHAYPTMLGYENIPDTPAKGAIVTFDNNSAGYLTAACLIPVFYNRETTLPLLFDDGSGVNSVPSGLNSIDIDLFTSGAKTETIAIANQYWTKAEVIILVQDYEWALLSAPIASQLISPMVYGDVTSQLASDLSTKVVIAAGDELDSYDGPSGVDVIHLSTKEDLWSFQLDIYDMMGSDCDYLVVTNPYDIETDVLMHGLSLSAGLLSCYRGALVQTGNLTVPRDLVDALTGATGLDNALYDPVVPYFHAVKDACWEAQEFMLERDHAPRFLGLVGGPFALPDYVLDIHITYHYWTKESHYIPTIAPFANFTDEKPIDTYVKEDAATGRIIADSILDASLLMFRTFFYKEFLTGGAYDPGFVWQNKSLLVDGHRLNQPEPGGPPDSPDEIYFPGEECMTEFNSAGFELRYELPRNESDPTDTNMSVPSIMEICVNSSVTQIVAHGNPEYVRFEVGIDPDTNESRSYPLRGDAIRDLGPTVPFALNVIGCNTGSFSRDMATNKTLPTSFIHIGAISYHASSTAQSICFQDEAPQGAASDLCIYQWEEAFSGNVGMGEAVRRAKWRGFKNWDDGNESRMDDSDPATFHYYGDPALEIFKPNVAYAEVNPLEVGCVLDCDPIAINGGSAFFANITATDPGTGSSIIPTSVAWTFNGGTTTGASSTFTAPTNKGHYLLEVDVEAVGYDDYSASYWVYVEEVSAQAPDEEEEDEIGTTSFLIAVGTLVVVTVILYVMSLKLKAKEKKEKPGNERTPPKGKQRLR